MVQKFAEAFLNSRACFEELKSRLPSSATFGCRRLLSNPNEKVTLANEEHTDPCSLLLQGSWSELKLCCSPVVEVESTAEALLAFNFPASIDHFERND
jgi:hypothetical protein